ncbi:DnaJ like protein subfamily C member 9 [Dictyocoela muelleri]|nr:DnaJ like protein subfamily C member 9 [Dictyocoela muelleri]
MNNKEIQSQILKLHPDRPGGNLKKFLELRKKLEEQKTKKSTISVNLKEFEDDYKNSIDEVEDLIHLYIKHKGNVNKIIRDHLFATTNDESRIIDILENEIKKKRIKSLKGFRKSIGQRKNINNVKMNSNNFKNNKKNIKRKKKTDLPDFLELSGMKKYDDLLDDLEKKYK